jgi:uncharacterized protein
VGRLIAWLGDLLVLLLIIRMISGLFSRGRTVSSRSRPTPPPERSGGNLVRDPQCGTYIPESRAVRVVANGKTLFFCSTSCRDAYAASTAATKGA